MIKYVIEFNANKMEIGVDAEDICNFFHDYALATNNTFIKKIPIVISVSDDDNVRHQKVQQLKDKYDFIELREESNIYGN